MNEDPTTQRSKRATQSTIGRGLVIQGNLEETPLPETVQFLQSLRKTGQLALERQEPRQSAGISFVDGRIVHAFCPPLVGEECFYHLLTWRSGRYVFLPNAVAYERTITTETNTLLLDGLRRLDELLRCEQRLPPRPTILYRRRDPELLREAQLSFHQWRAWRRLDGKTTIGELLDRDPDLAPMLVELIAQGSPAPIPITASCRRSSSRRRCAALPSSTPTAAMSRHACSSPAMGGAPSPKRSR